MENNGFDIIDALQKIIDLLTSVEDNIGQSSYFSEQLIGAFLGAFFAFLFFIIGNYIWDFVKRRTDWKKKNRLEHAYLERYFGDLFQIFENNKKLLAEVLDNYKNKRLCHLNFVLLPIRDDITMRISDRVLINKLEMYISNLKNLNSDLNNMNVFKDKINIDLIDISEEVRKRGEGFLIDYLKQIRGFDPIFDYNLSEVEEFAAENRILLKKYKNWEYSKSKFEEDYEKRKELIKKEIELMRKEKEENPMRSDYLSKLKKFRLYKSGDSPKGTRSE